MSEHNPYQSPSEMPDANAAPSIANMAGLWRSAFPLAIKIIPGMMLFIIIAIILMIPAVILASAVPNTIVNLAVLVYQLFVSGFMTGCLVYYVYQSSKGEGNVGFAINKGREKLVSMTGGSVLQATILVIAIIPVAVIGYVLGSAGIMLDGIIGVIFGVASALFILAITLRFSYYSLRVVVENDKAVESIRNSFDMTRGSLVHLFLVYLPLVAIVLVFGAIFKLAPEVIFEIIATLGYASFALFLVIYIVLIAYALTLMVMSYDFIKARRAALSA